MNVNVAEVDWNKIKEFSESGDWSEFFDTMVADPPPPALDNYEAHFQTGETLQHFLWQDLEGDKSLIEALTEFSKLFHDESGPRDIKCEDEQIHGLLDPDHVTQLSGLDLTGALELIKPQFDDGSWDVSVDSSFEDFSKYLDDWHTAIKAAAKQGKGLIIHLET